MKEIQTSIKRIYSRFVVLTAVVVFGAIAIAQAQKDPVEGQPGEPPQLLAGTVDAQPIPILNASDGGSPGSTDSASGVRPASADVELPDAMDAGPSVTAEWSQPLPPSNDSELGYDQPTDADGQAGYDALQAEDAPFDATPPQYADAAFATGDDSGYEPAGYDEPAYEDAPPLLPDHQTAPLQNDEFMAAESRRNPYRDSGANGDTSTSPNSPALPYDDAPPLLPNEQLPAADDYPPAAASNDYDDLPAVAAQPGGRPMPSADRSDGAYPPTLDNAGYDAPPASNGYDPGGYDARAATPVAAPRAAAPRSAATNAPTATPSASFSQPASRSVQATSPMSVARRNEFEATGRPGPQTMEGPQTPTLTLQKVAPPELQVGRAATFQIRVRNVGRVTADNVLIRDEVPAGTEFVDATPKATRAADGAVYWEIGSLTPGQEILVTMELMPTTEGPVGSVATVSFEASASARTRVTKPELVIEHTGPVKALLGDQVRFAIKLSNPGTGAATKVVLQEDVPTGLSHPSGSRLEYEVGTIEPGQTRHLELTLRAAQAGQVLNKIVATADANLIAEDAVELEVIAPDLQVSVEGPKRRFLERQATFTVSVANPGTAPAQNVELLAKLPPGLQFVSTNNSGYYDQSRHAVVWSLEQLPAGEMGRAQFTAMPIEIGSYQVRAEGRAEMDLTAEQEHPINIEGIAALLYVLTDKVDPLEVGGQTTYEIKVTNQGSKDAKNVRFAALVPDGMRAIGAQGPTAERLKGQQVEFDPLERLAPKQEAIFQVTIEGVTPGDHRFRVQMTSDEISTPVIKEESTRVYAD